MHKTLLAATALAALLAAAPANAQMCGPGQQAQASGQQAGGMMCGMMGRQAAADDPMADKPAQKPQQQSGMCPCCRNMSMMGGQHGQHHQMPGMQQQ